MICAMVSACRLNMPIAPSRMLNETGNPGVLIVLFTLETVARLIVICSRPSPSTMRNPRTSVSVLIRSVASAVLSTAVTSSRSCRSVPPESTSIAVDAVPHPCGVTGVRCIAAISCCAPSALQ